MLYTPGEVNRPKAVTPPPPPPSRRPAVHLYGPPPFCGDFASVAARGSSKSNVRDLAPREAHGPRAPEPQAGPAAAVVELEPSRASWPPVRLESALELAVLYTPGEVNRPKAVTPLLCFTHRGR